MHQGRRSAAPASWLLEPRYQVVAACFLATFTAYVERTGFSIAYTAMAKQGAVSEAVKGSVLSAFYWGYGLSQVLHAPRVLLTPCYAIFRQLSAGGWAAQRFGAYRCLCGLVILLLAVLLNGVPMQLLRTPELMSGTFPQVPGGWAAQRFGAYRCLCGSFAVWASACLVTPSDAGRTGGIVAARVAVGVAQGFLIPSVHTVLSQWIPPHERAKAVSLTTSGMYLGSAAAILALPAVVAAVGPWGVLRAVGCLGLAWLAMWVLIGKEVPHRTAVMPVQQDELKAGVPKPKGRPGATPWGRILAHPAIWAIVVNNFTFHYAFYVVMNWLPTYFDKVLHASLSDVGLVKALPYVVMFGASNAGGWAGDALIARRGQRSVAAARKAVNTAGFAGAALALLAMPAAPGVGAGVAATSAALGALGFARGGFSVNHMDVAPDYAGVVMGISNTAGTVSGIVGVAATGLLLQGAGEGSTAGWWQAFAVAAALGLAGCTVFLGFARGERLFGSHDQYL